MFKSLWSILCWNCSSFVIYREAGRQVEFVINLRDCQYIEHLCWTSCKCVPIGLYSCLAFEAPLEACFAPANFSAICHCGWRVMADRPLWGEIQEERGWWREREGCEIKLKAVINPAEDRSSSSVQMSVSLNTDRTLHKSLLDPVVQS